MSCEGMYVGTGCGASRGCPSGLCFLEVFWIPGPLALSAQPCLDLAIERALFSSEDSCGDREAALAGGGEVISTLSPPVGADSLEHSPWRGQPHPPRSLLLLRHGNVGLW